MAEYIFKDMVRKRGLGDTFTEIASCAVSREEIGNPVYPPARRELGRHGIGCQGHAARQITLADHDHYDLIILMDRSNMRILQRMWGDARMDKVRMLLNRDVADPWYTDDFETTYEDIVNGLEALIEEYSA
ncbi:MAG: low molecular weight phosphotyrosine protein phosphatase [Bacteroidales bacterium]|nr:low molecular weight phosphotyrosine protein phosphatase [Bacteroidales bacterium]